MSSNNTKNENLFTGLDKTDSKLKELSSDINEKLNEKYLKVILPNKESDRGDIRARLISLLFSEDEYNYLTTVVNLLSLHKDLPDNGFFKDSVEGTVQISDNQNSNDILGIGNKIYIVEFLRDKKHAVMRSNFIINNKDVITNVSFDLLPGFIVDPEEEVPKNKEKDTEED